MMATAAPLGAPTLFQHTSEKLLSVATTKALGELLRVLISMETNAKSLQGSIALLKTKRGPQEVPISA